MKLLVVFVTLQFILNSSAIPLNNFDLEKSDLDEITKYFDLENIDLDEITKHFELENIDLDEIRKHFDLENVDLNEIKNHAAAFYEALPKKLHEDATLLVPELIKKYGYPSERHTVITSDGYILELHRIPYGKSGPSNNRPAVLLQHGLLSSSADWVIPGPEKSLPYILADSGYDTWMANARGTKYSRKHVSLDPDEDAKQFFDFTWHEIGTLDLPAVIDYILNNNKQDKLFYIGHSQGTTVSYVLCAERPEYNDKLKAVISLAPSAYITNIRSPLRLLAPYTNQLEKLADKLHLYESTQANKLTARFGQAFCSDGSIFQIFCVAFVFTLFGYNPDQMNATVLPVILGHTPAGASWKQSMHYGQIYNSGVFGRWDYGIIGNQEHYGTDTPPKYHLENIKAPFHMFYSFNDWLSNATDVMNLYEQISSAKLHLVDKFNHADYLYAVDVRTLLNEDVISVLKDYQT